MKVTRFCPAKINLFLELTGKRPNGYHELATLFAKINLGDTLTVCATPSKQTHLSLSLTGPVGKILRADETNLVCRAARGFLEYFGITAHIEMTLDKHVPTGAGLGGGSSDAAGTLLALCEIFKKDKNELLPLAAKLGADVPLFMYEDTFLKGEGIGEKLTPVCVKGSLPELVLIYPNVSVPTAGIFHRAQLPDESSISARCEQLDNLIAALKTGQPLSTWARLLFNRLEEFVLPFYPAVKQVISNFKSARAQAVLMSGSGSTVFALAPTAKQAQHIAARIHNPNYQVYCVGFYSPSK